MEKIISKSLALLVPGITGAVSSSFSMKRGPPLQRFNLKRGPELQWPGQTLKIWLVHRSLTMSQLLSASLIRDEWDHQKPGSEQTCVTDLLTIVKAFLENHAQHMSSSGSSFPQHELFRRLSYRSVRNVPQTRVWLEVRDVRWATKLMLMSQSLCKTSTLRSLKPI